MNIRYTGVPIQKPGHCALRKGRSSEIGRLYLVSIVTYNREPLFRDLFTGRILVSEMRRLQDEGYVQSKAWVIMPDHLHWLFDLTEAKDLTGVIKLLKGRSARKINAYLMRKETVWSKAFHDHALRKEEDIRGIARYIVSNPLRAKLVENIGSYPLWDAVWL